jgi:hypothetical protein
MAAVEIRRVLKEGGVLLATVPNMAFWRLRADFVVMGRWNPQGDFLSLEQPWRDPHIRFFNTGTLRRMLVHAEFTNVKIGGINGGFLSCIPVLRRASALEPCPVYRLLERAIPSLFGGRLYAVASR